MIRVVHLTKGLNGGAGQYVTRLNQALIDAGLDSRIITADSEKKKNILIRLIRRTFFSLVNRITTDVFYQSCVPFYILPRSLAKADIIHLHSVNGWIDLSQLAKFKNKVTCWTLHDIWPITGGCVVYRGCTKYTSGCNKCPIFNHPFKNLASFNLIKKRDILLKSGLKLIANSQWTQGKIYNSLVAHSQKHVPIISPSIGEDYNNLKISGCYKVSEQIVIGLSARSVNAIYKGIRQFFQYLEDNAYPWLDRAKFLVAGDGEISHAKNMNVEYSGTVSDQKSVINFYKRCHLFVSPSLMETFGMTLIEAQACGRPVVAFDVGGTRETIIHKKTGWLAPLRDYNHLCEGIQWCISELENETFDARYSSSRITKEFSMKTQVREQILYYNQLLCH